MSHEESIARYNEEVRVYQEATSRALGTMPAGHRRSLALWVEERGEYLDWPGWRQYVGKPPARGRVDR